MRFSGWRGHVILGSVTAMLVLGGTGIWFARVATSTQERELIRHAGVGLAFADSLERALTSRPFARISAAEAVASLYLERLRLGLGSPFRLVEQAVRDPALDAVGSRELAEAMLARTMLGDSYWPRKGALDLIYVSGRDGSGVEHQAIIDSVIAAHPDPRVGELSIRLAYRLASASGSVSPRAPELATAAAAQARDRILSMRDARALFTAADRDGLNRLTLLRIWRDSRKFAVEQPIIVPLSTRNERSAVETLPELVARIERVAASSGFSETARNSHGTNLERHRDSALPERMSGVAAVRDHPPMAPVLIAIRAYSGVLRGGDGRPDRATRLRFQDRASNEETLAAEYALLAVRTRSAVPEADAALLTAAVALRAFAQESAWLTGDPAPTVRDLQARFGVAVTYDASARRAWRPFFQRTLETAIMDVRRVLPAFDASGLRVHFGGSPLGERALALHDPMRRTIYFPPASHSGVMAHEFAHDLDWQAARRMYGGTGWYRTDHALRRRADQLAGALRQMASATADTARMTGVTRPTEVLARNVDWFVSASLAREGRLNGHLSAAQDPVLTGYASAITPEAARDGGSATLRALEGLTLVPELTRSWFDGLFGEERRMGVHEAVRRVLEAPLDRVKLTTEYRGWDPALALEFELTPRSGSWTCLVETFAGSPDEWGAVRAVVQYAAEWRARGIVRQWAEFARRRPHASPPRLRALGGGPWDPALAESTFQEIRDAILGSALTAKSRTADGGWITSGPRPEC